TLLKSPAGIDTINVHPSLLPLYRGPSPIESAILAGDKKTGVSIMVLDDKMDHGPIIAQEEEAIDDEYDDFITLSERLEKLAAKMIIDVIPKFINHQINPRPQNHQATTTCKLIKKEDGKIDFKKDANNVLRHIRAFVHWPGSYTTWKVEPRGAESAEASRAEHGRIVRVEHRERRRKKNKTIKIIEARLQNQLPEPPFTAGMVFKTSNGKPAIICGNQAIVIETIQIEGKKPTDSISFLNGYPDFIGGNLG
ncbi:MAG: methionyl-tRNA formyltransferase, partial [Candidatus Berkelbacteria bacterium]|nr:methionyl-tRNA formyltransferase [Candidatus Berkelbacteria bacterium]